MPDFAYTARDSQGQKISGTLTASSEREVLTILTGKSLFPVQIAAEQQRARWTSRKRVRGQIMATAYGQLAALMRSGVPLLRSLGVLRDQTTQLTLKEVLSEVYQKVEEGQTLAEAMARHPRVFSEMAISMVRAGGEGGFLEDALERVAQFTEQQDDLRSRTIGALAYPAFLASVGTSIVAVLIIFFVPYFDTLFDNLREQGELPLLTDWLLALSRLLQTWGLLLVFATAMIVALLRSRLQTEEGKRLRDRLKLRTPLVGHIFQSLAVARFCRVLGTLLHNGVPILKSLEISRQATGNRILADAIANASENISAGQSLAGPLGQSGYFPPAVVEMISVAEESNTLEKVLVDVADSLERRTMRRLDLLVRLLEPIMLLILAGVVLCVVIALLLPVLKMSSTI